MIASLNGILPFCNGAAWRTALGNTEDSVSGISRKVSQLESVPRGNKLLAGLHLKGGKGARGDRKVKSLSSSSPAEPAPSSPNRC